MIELKRIAESICKPVLKRTVVSGIVLGEIREKALELEQRFQEERVDYHDWADFIELRVGGKLETLHASELGLPNAETPERKNILEDLSLLYLKRRNSTVNEKEMLASLHRVVDDSMSIVDFRRKSRLGF